MRTFGKVVQRLAVGYVALVVVVAIGVMIVLGQPTEDANLAGVWLIFVTLPLSMLTMLLPLQGTLMLLVLTATGLVQAGLLWLIGRAFRKSS